jgi:hypothetical protein
MAVIQISRIQHRRGLESDLPNLASAELGWSVDTRKLYVGNGTIEEGAPSLGKTEILTEYSIIDLSSTTNAGIAALRGNVALTGSGNLAIVNGNLTSVTTRVSALEAGAQSYSTADLYAGASSAVLTRITTNNAVVSYTMGQGSSIRNGSIVISRSAGTVTYTEEYTETVATDVVFTMNANTTTANLNYSATTSGNLQYRVSYFN